MLSTLGVAALLAAVAFPRSASAEIKITENNGWSLTTDGRLAGFLSIARGAALPPNEENFTGVFDEATPDQKVESARVRTGFITSVFGFNLTRTLTPGLVAKGRVALWMLASSARTWGDEPAVNAREAYFKLDGQWGGFLAGRAMSLFSRGNILLNYDLEHAMGLGFPCTISLRGPLNGGSCGHSGFGVLFPGFHAGLVYNTPELAGLQLSAGLYDPAVLNEASIRRAPLPRVEAELTFKTPQYFHAFAGVLWQKLSKNTSSTDPVTMASIPGSKDFEASGVSYGAGVNLGPLAVGFAGYFGKGLGLYTPLEDNPINFLTTGELRSQSGYYGAASITLGETKLAGGVGISSLKADASDPPSTEKVITPKQQLGFSAGVYQGLYKTVTFALEYFRSEVTWFDRGDVVGTNLVVTRPRQAVNFVNVGATLVW
jgi:hypothetical protein